MKKKDLENLPVEIRFIPLPPEETTERQRKLINLLLKGAINNSKTTPPNSD